MIDYADAVQEFHSELLSCWPSRVKLRSSNFVLQEVWRSHGCNTSRERNTNIRGGNETEKKEYYLRRSEMVKGPSCEIKFNLQLDECIMWAAAKYESFTLCVVHLTNCRPGLTHVGIIPLQLLRCTSGQVTGPQVSWVMTVYSLICMPVEKRERLALGQMILLIVLFS